MLDIGGCILDCLLSLSFYHRSSAVSRVPVKVVGTQGIMVRSTSVGTCRSVGESGAVQTNSEFVSTGAEPYCTPAH